MPIITKTTGTAKGASGEKKFRSLLKWIPDGIVVVDADGHITQVNVQTEKMFGYTRQELIGQLVDVLVPKRFRASYLSFRAQYISNPTVIHRSEVNLYGLHKSGREIPVDISLGSLQIEGRLVVTAIIRDISRDKQIQKNRDSLEELVSERTRALQEEIAERKQVEKALREQHRLQEVLLHISRSVQEMVHSSDLEHVMLVCLSQVRKVGVDAQTMAINRLRPEEGMADTYRVGPEGVVFFSGQRYKGRKGGLIKRWQSGKADYGDVKGGETEVFREKFGGLSIRSYIDVPFSLGVISAHSTSPSAFSDADETILKRVGEILSVGISRMEDLERVEQQAHIMAQVHDSIITIDLEGGITSLNRGAERLHGYTEEESFQSPCPCSSPKSTETCSGTL